MIFTWAHFSERSRNFLACKGIRCCREKKFIKI